MQPWCFLLHCLWIPFYETKIVSRAFPTDYVKGSTLELGIEQVRQPGEDGKQEVVIVRQRQLPSFKVKESTVSEKEISRPVKKMSLKAKRNGNTCGVQMAAIDTIAMSSLRRHPSALRTKV